MVSAQWRRGTLTTRRIVLLVSVAVLSAASAAVYAQERFELFVFAMDASGPILDLTTNDVAVREAGGDADVISVQRFGWPVKVTILLDNGAKTESMLLHVRNGLKRFFDGIPREVPVSLITTAPSPRWLIRDTTDRIQIEKGIGLVVPDSSYGRFSDSLVEYARRLDEEFRGVGDGQLPPYLPVLIVVSTTEQDGSLVRKEDNMKMILSLRRHRVWTNFVMITPARAFQGSDLGTQLDVSADAAQIAELAKATQEYTGGRYFPLGGTGVSGLATKVLPDLAADVALRYIKQMTQHRVVVERREGVRGPLTDLGVAVNRAGADFVVSPDGNMP